jgi:hypothetical protein
MVVSMTKDEALKLALEALEKLWNIIDDIDTYGDMAKADEKLYRSLVERRQRTRFEETGITTDGYELSGGAITAIKEALAQPEQKSVAMADYMALTEKYVALKSAVLTEREACAKVCDDLWEDDGTAYECAEAIRARGQA